MQEIGLVAVLVNHNTYTPPVFLQVLILKEVKGRLCT